MDGKEKSEGFDIILFMFSMICGQRVRVEHAKARSGNPRGPPSHGGYRGGE